MLRARAIFICLLAIAGFIGAPVAASAASWIPSGGTSLAPPTHRTAFGLRADSAPAGAHLTYFGGPVVSNVSVQSVYWGGGTYEPGVGPGQTPITEFLQGVTDSPYLDWLSEYDTPTQHIGRGRYQGQATITVSSANGGPILSSGNIADELDHQISTGALPPPELDAAGQVKTLYAVFFPSTITLQDRASDGTLVTGGEAGGFCAYHSTTLHDGLSVPFMVLPDFQTHHFALGCGTDSLLLNDFTSVAAHELVESITDPNLGWVGWYDEPLGQEVADLCQGSDEQGTIGGGNGIPYVVQKEFSNIDDTCVVRRNVAAPASTTYLDACGLASRQLDAFVDAGLAADCLKQYGIALGKNDGTFGENDALVRSQVSSLLVRLIESSGATLTQTRSFPDVAPLSDDKVRTEIELLAGSGIIQGLPDGLFHPSDNLSVAQATTLVMRTLAYIHAPSIADQGTTGANYAAALQTGLLDPMASNVHGFAYDTVAGDVTDRGLLADALAQAVQRLVDAGAITSL